MSDFTDVPSPAAEVPPPAEPAPLPHGPRPVALAVSLCMLLFALFLFVGIPSQILQPAFGVWFNEIFVFLGVPWVLLRLSGRDPVRYPRATAPDLGMCALAFLVGTANFFALVIPIQSVVQMFVPSWLKDLFDSSQIFKNQTPLELGLIVAGVGIAAPVCEEYFFRGVFQNLLAPRARAPVGALLVITLTAVVFSAFHLDPVGFLARVELGALFGYLFYRTGSLWPGVMAHAANNLVSTVLYFVAKDFADSDESPDWRVLAGMVLVGAPVVLALLRSTIRKAAPSHEEPAPPAGPTPSFGTLAWPWILGGCVSFLLLFAVDRRGVALNVYDQIVPLPPERASDPAETKREREELQKLRSEARAGRVPLDRYVERRRELSRESRPSKLPPAPKPKTLPPTTGEGP